jgi:hypothetical protein
MISRVALTGTCLVQKDITGRPFALVLKRFSVALVLLLLSAATVRAQEPEQWPQDDDYAPQQPAYGSTAQQQPYDYAQSDPQSGYGQQPGYGQPAYGQQQLGAMPSQALNAEQLEQLVAPIALYPDSLVAQILAASTYPAEVAAADQWVRSMGGAPPDQIAAGANAQTGWDPSVKALTAYPQVLAMLNQNLQWTTALGNAYYNQPQDVTETIQVLRQRAQAAGNLQSTPQEQVASDQGYISVAPANPEMVYVPTYNPWVVYGQPIAAYPGYEPIDTVGAIVGSAVQFGLEFAVGAFFRAPFGFMGWGLDWFGHAVLFNNDIWCSRSGSVRDWGFPNGGARYFRGGDWGNGYGRHGDYGRGGYGRGGEYGRGGYGRGGYGNGGWNAYRNQPGFNQRGGQYPVARPGGGYGYGRGNQGGYDRGANYPVARPGQGDGRYLGGSNRGSLGYNGGSRRGFFGSGSHPQAPQQYAYNHGPTPTPLGGTQTYRGNPQFFANRGQNYGYGSQTYSRPPQVSNYGRSPYGAGGYSRPSPGFGGAQSYRVPSQMSGYSRSPGNGYAGNSGRGGGGFHMFGGGHNNSPSYGGGSHSFGGGGGGHSFGGGGHSFGGGGGHSFGGGGHSFGGGHSGGGHSGGGGGHGHHR